jgi:hypothetical protein
MISGEGLGGERGAVGSGDVAKDFLWCMAIGLAISGIGSGIRNQI